MLRYKVGIDLEVVASFADPLVAERWASEEFETEMLEPMGDRVHQDYRVVDSQTAEVIWIGKTQDNTSHDGIAELSNPNRSGYTQFRILTLRERIKIRDALEHRADMLSSSQMTFQALIDTLRDDDNTRDVASRLSDALKPAQDDARGLRTMGDFLMRNHVVVHCKILIPEI